MGVVTVVALYQSFVDAVMERAVEVLLHFLVATVAEEGSLLLHQELAFLRMVGRVAVYAAHVVLQVCGACEVAMLFAVCVASQATRADFLGRGILECKDLRLIAATINMRFPWTVACLASMPLWPFFRIQRGHIVR